jgi:hypothetical protein
MQSHKFNAILIQSLENMATEKQIIDYIVTHYKCNYHARVFTGVWESKETGGDRRSCSSEVILHFFGITATHDNHMMVDRLFLNEHIQYLCTPPSLFQTNFKRPQLLDAIKYGESLEDCNTILEENPATVYATDKYGNGPLYHLVKRSLRSKTQDTDFINIFNEIIDITGIPKDDVNGQNMLYFVSSSEVLAKRPSFLETLILRGLNVNFVFGSRFDYIFGEVSRTLLGRILESVIDDDGPSESTIIRLIEMMVQRGANINWVDEYGFATILRFDDWSKYDYVLEYFLCNGANFRVGVTRSDTRTLCEYYDGNDAPRKAAIVNRWPTMMAMIVFECLGIYHMIDCDTWIDLFLFTSEL